MSEFSASYQPQMLTAYIPDSHVFTFSLSPACWTLRPAWALDWKSFRHQL